MRASERKSTTKRRFARWKNLVISSRVQPQSKMNFKVRWKRFESDSLSNVDEVVWEEELIGEEHF